MPGMLPQDVLQLTGVADPRLSPDGTTVAYVVTGLDGEANEYRGAIWLAALDGSSPPRRLTAGARRDADPRWSPDGSRLAFTSNRAGDTMQLYVLPVGGGEPRRLTDLKEDVTQAAWSPDGATIAFVSRVRDAAYDEEDDKRRAPRRFARLQYKLEHVGWTGDRPMHLFTVPADGSGEPVQITSGDVQDAAPAWSPDGATLAFVSARHPDWDIEPVSDVYLVDAVGGADGDEPLRLTQGGGASSCPRGRPRATASPCCATRASSTTRGTPRWRWSTPPRGAITLLTQAARPQLRHLPQPARAHLGRRRPRLHRRGQRQRAPLPRGRRRRGQAATWWWAASAR